MYWLIHWRYSFYLYDYLLSCIDSLIDSFIAGKTMENLSNRPTVELVTSEQKLKKLAAQPFFEQFKNFPWKPGGTS